MASRSAAPRLAPSPIGAGGAEERIFAIRGQFLWALDIKTGKLVSSFGTNGRVDLKPALGALGKAMVFWNFAPFVCNDVVMVGVSLNDNIKTREEPPGIVQAFDVAYRQSAVGVPADSAAGRAGQ